MCYSTSRPPCSCTPPRTDTDYVPSLRLRRITLYAALYLQAYPHATPAQVMDFITCASTKNVISGDLAGTPNRLLYLDAVDGAFPPPGTPCAAMGQPSPSNPNASPPPTCPRGCSGNGACSAAGKCACTCNTVGVDCSIVLNVVELTGLSGSVKGSTLTAKSNFGDPSPDAYFALTVPSDGTVVSVTTCNDGTDFDTTLFLLRRCVSATGADALQRDTIAVVTVFL